MVKIITDSTADLGTHIAAEFGILVLPLSVAIGGKVYLDGVEICQKDLFGPVEKYGELPKTAAPPVGEFIKASNDPGGIILIGISSKLSAIIQNALLAAGTFPVGKVRVIDSLTL